jgi:hypothetical protein
MLTRSVSLQLIQRLVAELFGAAAEAVSWQARDQHLRPRDLGLGFEQQVLQRRWILRPWGGCDGHQGTVNPRFVPHHKNPA